VHINQQTGMMRVTNLVDETANRLVIVVIVGARARILQREFRWAIGIDVFTLNFATTRYGPLPVSFIALESGQHSLASLSGSS
jgi:hypothetical protein